MSKKEAIIDAATELFAHKGFNGTAASEIATKAGVAQGTVFHHFKNKENLLISICDELVQDYVQGILRSAEGPGTGWDALERVLRFSMDFLKKRANSISVAFRETGGIRTDAEEVQNYFKEMMMKIITVIEECIHRGQSDGSIRDVPPYETAFLIHTLIKGIHHSQMHGILDTPDLHAEFVDFCSRSLCAENQLKKS